MTHGSPPCFCSVNFCRYQLDSQQAIPEILIIAVEHNADEAHFPGREIQSFISDLPGCGFSVENGFEAPAVCGNFDLHAGVSQRGVPAQDFDAREFFRFAQQDFADDPLAVGDPLGTGGLPELSPGSGIPPGAGQRQEAAPFGGGKTLQQQASGPGVGVRNAIQQRSRFGRRQVFPVSGAADGRRKRPFELSDVDGGGTVPQRYRRIAQLKGQETVRFAGHSGL